MISKLQVAAPLGFGGVASLGSHQEAIGQLPPPLSPGNEGPDIVLNNKIIDIKTGIHRLPSPI